MLAPLGSVRKIALQKPPDLKDNETWIFDEPPFCLSNQKTKKKCGKKTRHWLTIEDAFIDGGCVLLCYELATGYGEPQGRGREKEMKQTQPRNASIRHFLGKVEV